MKDIISKIGKWTSLPHQGRILYAILLSMGFFLIITALQSLIAAQTEYYNARAEYKQIRALHYTAPLPRAPLFVVNPTELVAEQSILVEGQSGSMFESTVPSGDNIVSPPADLLELNPDYAGWIAIEGMAIDYPIARGPDNQVYLKTSFSGQRNSAGSIFMDYRCQQGFDEAVCILYGHNMKDGTMFAPLFQYLDAAFINACPDITITTPSGETLIYRVFDARYTNVLDKAYSLDFADSAVDRLLILSTCISGADKDARLLIYSELTAKR